MKKAISSGIEDFRDVITEDCYYVDKTFVIKNLFKIDKSKVILITRPRRFGKTLTLSTIKYFLSNSIDKESQKNLFKDTEIFKDTEFCNSFMGKFPVIFVSLKDVKRDNFKDAYNDLARIIFELTLEFRFLLNSTKLDELDKNDFKQLSNQNYLEEKSSNLIGSIKLLCYLLSKHYGQKVVLLIDEYDVPLATAAHFDFYNEMVNIISGLLSSSLKSNTYLQKGILTGCLRVVKESIFTGLNNLIVNTVFDINNPLATAIGFTSDEVKSLLDYYGFNSVYDKIKNWYDGYNLDGHEIYCPWDVLNYIMDNLTSKNKEIFYSKNYWINTSSNDVIKDFLGFIDEQDTDRMQILVSGGEIEVAVNETLNYSDLKAHESADFWTLLLYTGYLTTTKRTNLEESSLKFMVRIPNLEIRDCFEKNIIDYFTNSPKYKEINKSVTEFLLNGKAELLADTLNLNLTNYISTMDLGSNKLFHENYYHGYLNGHLSAQGKIIKNYQSNAESGHGRADIMFTSFNNKIGVIIEIKLAKSESNLDDSAKKGLEQIIQKNYAHNYLQNNQIKVIHAYGISFYKKTCTVAYKQLR